MLGNPFIAIDLWEVATDVRVGWCFATIRNNALEVEDFFVRPEYQHGSHWQILASHVFQYASQLDLPIGFWIAHADTRSKSSNLLSSTL